MICINTYKFLSTSSARRTTVGVFSADTARQYFYPRPPRGGRPYSLALVFHTGIFLSTSSARRTTWRLPPPPIRPKYFYPRPPRGGRRHGGQPQRPYNQHFYPRPPRGGRHVLTLYKVYVIMNFYPRPPRGGRLLTVGVAGPPQAISIHVLREEDDGHGGIHHLGDGISIHVLREEDDRTVRQPLRRPLRFLSTSSARRTTANRSCAHLPKQISIHVLREEDDGWTMLRVARITQFLSTSSARRTTIYTVSECSQLGYFYPRPPRGGRPRPWPEVPAHPLFLSTSSARRTTRAPLPAGAKTLSHFYPRPPRGGRQQSC